MKNNLTLKINNILKSFEVNTGINFSLDRKNKKSNVSTDYVVNFISQNINKKFLIQYKNNLNRASISMIKLKFAEYNEEILIVTDYVNPRLAQFLKDININYIDMAGNAFIKSLPIYIDISGCKKNETGLNHKQSRLFKVSGMKVIFTILSNPSIVSTSYRNISNLSGVSLGSVDWIIKDLVEAGYMVLVKKGKRLLKKKEQLFKRWVETYPEQLRPKILLGKYKKISAKNKMWKDNKELEDGFFWGGEVASAILTNYLKPEIITVYGGRNVNRFIGCNKLVASPEGNIELLEKFWSFDDKYEKDGLVPPLLIYADLVCSNNSRNLETAEIIYEKFIDEYIREA